VILEITPAGLTDFAVAETAEFRASGKPKIASFIEA
jgi:hypothetical protein